MEETPPLRPWLFRIAHNRALDLLRGRAVRKAEPIEAAFDVADEASPDPVEMLMRQEAVKTAVSRYAELPILQRSVVILKDVLDEQLSEIAALLDLRQDRWPVARPRLARGPGGDRGVRRPRRCEAQLHDVARLARRQNQLHPRLQVCPLCRRRRRADAGAGLTGIKLGLTNELVLTNVLGMTEARSIN